MEENEKAAAYNVRIGASAPVFAPVNNEKPAGRTIADLDASAHVRPEHLSEAIDYRNPDREGRA